VNLIQECNATSVDTSRSNTAEFNAQFNGPYEEALGTARSAPSNTMRKAPRSYFYMRPQNRSQNDGE
ncbi:hypothetical protein V1509DRAFT_614278, partial [Lipomyces kononenkoae]